MSKDGEHRWRYDSVYIQKRTHVIYAIDMCVCDPYHRYIYYGIVFGLPEKPERQLGTAHPLISEAFVGAAQQCGWKKSWGSW